MKNIHCILAVGKLTTKLLPRKIFRGKDAIMDNKDAYRIRRFQKKKVHHKI